MMTITQPAAKFLLTSDPLAKGLFISQQINVIPCGPVFRLSRIPVGNFPLTACNIGVHRVTGWFVVHFIVWPTL